MILFSLGAKPKLLDLSHSGSFYAEFPFSVWFFVIAEEGSCEFVSELAPVLLGRTGLLFVLHVCRILFQSLVGSL